MNTLKSIRDDQARIALDITKDWPQSIFEAAEPEIRRRIMQRDPTPDDHTVELLARTHVTKDVMRAICAYADWLGNILVWPHNQDIAAGFPKMLNSMKLPSCSEHTQAEMATQYNIEMGPSLVDIVIHALSFPPAGMRLPPIGVIQGEEIVIDHQGLAQWASSFSWNTLPSIKNPWEEPSLRLI